MASSFDEKLCDLFEGVPSRVIAFLKVHHPHLRGRKGVLRISPTTGNKHREC